MYTTRNKIVIKMKVNTINIKFNNFSERMRFFLPKRCQELNQTFNRSIEVFVLLSCCEFSTLPVHFSIHDSMMYNFFDEL